MSLESNLQLVEYLGGDAKRILSGLESIPDEIRAATEQILAKKAEIRDADDSLRQAKMLVKLRLNGTGSNAEVRRNLLDQALLESPEVQESEKELGTLKLQQDGLEADRERLCERSKNLRAAATLLAACVGCSGD